MSQQQSANRTIPLEEVQAMVRDVKRLREVVQGKGWILPRRDGGLVTV